MRSILIIFFIATISAHKLSYLYTTKFIEVPLDHFSFTSNATFQLRYLVNDTYHVERGPIFFYTGNEGDINMFAQNTGFIFDIAPLFNALIIFAEHRYYGTSLPFGNKSYDSPEHLGYLSSEQALADFVYLINELQKTYCTTEDLKKLPVVAFGGSYGGMLSSWLRMKYPNTVVGSIASSAPIWQFQGLTPCENFYRITTNVFESLGSKTCRDVIKKSWPLMRAAGTNNTRKANLSHYWKLCKPLNTTDDIENFVSWVSGIYVDLAMLNYPYPTDFLTKLPAYPVREFCSKIQSSSYKDDDALLQVLAKALQVYTNFTGEASCNDITSAGDLGTTGWNFQSCTEMIMPMCSNHFDMFEEEEWNFHKYSEDCYKQFKVRPRDPDVPILAYGGKNLKPYSNIVFSNGLQDPWSSGGVLSNISSKVLAVIIPDGAHHADLRGRHDGDAETVIEARRFHVREIRKWLNEFYYEYLSEPKIFYT